MIGLSSEEQHREEEGGGERDNSAPLDTAAQQKNLRQETQLAGTMLFAVNNDVEVTGEWEHSDVLGFVQNAPTVEEVLATDRVVTFESMAS